MSKEQICAESTSLTSVVSDDPSKFMLAQFSALREEILKRTEIQHQLITLAVVASGAFLSVNIGGLQTVPLAYPVLAMFLAAAWSQNNVRILQIGGYIKENIEKKLLANDLGWEHHVGTLRGGGKFGSLSFLASRGILIGTQLLTVGVSIFKTDFPKKDIALLILDAGIIFFTIFLLRPRNIDKEAGYFFGND